MKKAVAMPQYSDVAPFSQPTGVVDVQLDKATNLLATPACPETYTAAFIAGTEPNQTCDQPNGVKGFFSKMFGLGGEKVLPPPENGQNQAQAGQTQANQGQETNPDGSKKKKGIFGKFVGIFKDDKPSNPPSSPPDNSGNGPH